MRVKVNLNNVGLVIPCGEPTDRVERLLLDIGSRFENHGIKTGELRIAQLQTSDGYLIHPKEYIKDVIRDNEVLVALDYDEYMQNQEKFCKTTWLSVVESDYKDSEAKWITTGLHEHNKLFVKFGTGWPNGKSAKLLRLELFDVDSLQHFAKEGRVLIGSKSDNDGNWKIEAHFLIEKGTAQAVEISIKTASMFQAIIKKVGITITGKKLEKGEVSTVQSEIPLVDTSNTIPLPADSQSGPSFPDKATDPIKVENNHVATGDVPLTITQKDKVYADQSYVRDGKFTNFFYSEFDLVNASNSEVAISKITSEYQNAKGEWVEVNTRSGYKSGYYNYSWNSNGKFNLKSLGQDTIAVCTEIVITSPQFERLRRAHASLPQPLKIKINFHDVHGKVSSVIVEQANGPRDIYTKESKSEYDKKPIDQWIQCDDTNMEARIWGLLRKETDSSGDYLVIQVSPNTYSQLRATHYGEYVWDAIQKKTGEVEIGSLYENNGCTGKSSLLVDLEKKKVYGVKIELKTTTSHVVKHFRIPELAVSK